MDAPCNAYGDSVWDEEFWKLMMVMVIQQYEYS